jgi:hypothetical protein
MLSKNMLGLKHLESGRRWLFYGKSAKWKTEVYTKEKVLAIVTLTYKYNYVHHYHRRSSHVTGKMYRKESIKDTKRKWVEH